MQETHIIPSKNKETQTEKEKMESKAPCNQNRKNTGVLILTSYKVDSKSKFIRSDKEDNTTH